MPRDKSKAKTPKVKAPKLTRKNLNEWQKQGIARAAEAAKAVAENDRQASRGRPTLYSDELGREICSRLADGKTLSRISIDMNISMSSFFLWLKENKDFSDNYTRARQIQAERWADEIVQFSDEPLEGTRIKIVSGRLPETLVGDNVERAKLKVDARKWVVSRLLPKKYGDWKRGDPQSGDRLQEVLAALQAGPAKKAES